MAAVNDSVIIQQIYEQFMALGSKICSKEPIFDIKRFINIMKAIIVVKNDHIQELNIHQTLHNTNTDRFYKLRGKYSSFKTNINISQYPNLHNILNERFDSIIKSNKRSLFNIQDRKYFNTTKKLPKDSFTYHDSIKMFGISNIYEPYINFSEPSIPVIQINTELDPDTIIETSTIKLDKPEPRYPLHLLCIYHTSKYDSRNTILKYVADIWLNLTSENECYKIHWLLATACPFLRGSAGFAKVMLNAALLRCKLHPVKETMYYLRQTDWVAMLSPTFDEYYAKKAEMFEEDKMFEENVAKIESSSKLVEEYANADMFNIAGGYRKKTRITRKKHRKYIK